MVSYPFRFKVGRHFLLVVRQLLKNAPFSLQARYPFRLKLALKFHLQHTNAYEKGQAHTRSGIVKRGIRRIPGDGGDARTTKSGNPRMWARGLSNQWVDSLLLRKMKEDYEEGSERVAGWALSRSPKSASSL